jgi:hypothetical protein
MTKREKEILFDAEKGIYELRDTIKERGKELNSEEFACIRSGFLNGVVSVLNTLGIEMSEDFEEETLALMKRIK